MLPPKLPATRSSRSQHSIGSFALHLLRGTAATAVCLSLVQCTGTDERPPSVADGGGHRPDGSVSVPEAGEPDSAGDGSASASDAGLLVPDSSLGAADGSAPGEGSGDECEPGSSGNPIVDGWYADPDMKVYEGVYWVYPTYSAPYHLQTHLDAFSSTDLVHWTKHERVLDTTGVSWATYAIWAPSPIERDGTYYLYFGANDIQDNTQLGGIGVAKADRPEGPFVDALGAPLIGRFENGAQPIDQNVFIDDDGQAYLYYGGHGRCNVVRLNADMVSLGTFEDGTTFREITPPGYVEGALMFKRAGRYYFMWSEGGWTGPDYRVSYALADSPVGPFAKQGTILSQNLAVATGSGHNTVVNIPGTDDWYIFYHRRPLGVTDGNHRVLSYDRLYFNDDGTVAPVVMQTRDNFCDENALGWTTYGGRFRVRDGKYVVEPAADAKALLNTNYASLAYQAEVAVGQTGDAGLLFRVSAPGEGVDAYRGYYVGLDAQNDRVLLGKVNDTGYHELFVYARALDAGVAYQLKVVANGAALEVHVDGAPVIRASDGEFTSGMVGVRAHESASAFDRVSVGKPEGATFYEHGAFGGVGITLGAGEYTTRDLLAAGIADDSVSSLELPRGWTAEVFGDDAFGGTRWTFSESAAALPGEANDQMSSLRVRAGP